MRCRASPTQGATADRPSATEAGDLGVHIVVDGSPHNAIRILQRTYPQLETVNVAEHAFHTEKEIYTGVGKLFEKQYPAHKF